MDNEGEAMNNGHICQKELIITEHQRQLDIQSKTLQDMAESLKRIERAFVGDLDKSGFVATIEGIRIELSRAITNIGDIQRFIDGQKNLFIKVILTAIASGFVAAWIKGIMGGGLPTP